MTIRKQRIVQLDGLRAIAIGAVFLHHAFQVPMLWLGVDLFFILSGFLITDILLSDRHKAPREYFGHFYQRRAKRILPPYAVLLIFASAVLGFHGWIHHWYLYLFLMNVLVAFQIPHPQSLMMLWSLAVEEQFYVFWPWVVLYCDETLIGLLAAALLILVPVLRWLCTPFFANEWPIYALTPFRMDCLAAGALLCVVWRKAPEFLRRYGTYALVLPVVSLAGLQWLGSDGITTSRDTPIGNIMIYEFSMWGCFGVMAWALAGRGVAVLRSKPLVYLGRISYTVYLVQLLMLQICSRYLTGRFVIAASALVLILGFATVSWFLLEKPLLQGRIPWLAGTRAVEHHPPNAVGS